MMILTELPPEVQTLAIKSHLSEYGEYSGYREGSFGEIHTLTGRADGLVAKCPKRTRFRNSKEAREALGKLVAELSLSFAHYRYDGIQRWSDIKFIHHWPFLIGRLRKGTMNDLIKAPHHWNLSDRLSSLIMTAHSLSYCYNRGMAAHQDLKPENILFDSVVERFLVPDDYTGPKNLIYVADFGMANAFRDIGVNAGSRPYMAPEQFSRNELIDGSKIDVFALAVIAFECLCDGLHPIGEMTEDVWPVRLPTMPGKWGHENVWKSWARKSPKDIRRRLSQRCRMFDELGSDASGLADLIEASLSADPSKRPEMKEFENRLWETLDSQGALRALGLRVVIDYLDKLALDAEPHGWPHLEDQLEQARRAYAEWDID